MNWLDLIIIIIAIIGAYIGWKQGFIRSAVTFAGLIVGIVLAGQWSPSLADSLSSSEAEWAYFLAFGIILIIALIIANIVGKILKVFTRFLMLDWLDSLGGMFFGLLVGALAVAAILASLGAWAHNVPGNEIIDSTMAKAIGDSALAELLIDNFGLILGLLPDKFDSVKDFFN